MKYFNKEYLNFICLKRNLFPGYVAIKINVKYNTIVRWINGNQEPSIENIHALAKFFKVKVSEFIKHENTDKYNYNLNNKYTKELLEYEIVKN